MYQSQASIQIKERKTKEKKGEDDNLNQSSGKLSERCRKKAFEKLFWMCFIINRPLFKILSRAKN